MEDSEHADWDYPAPFDYIHLRCTLICFDDHRTVIQKSYGNLKSGGWIEIMDPVFYPHCEDGTLQGSNLERLFQIFDRAATANGKDLKIARNYQQWLVEAGFIDVVEEVAPGPGKFSVDLCILLFSSPPRRKPHRGLPYEPESRNMTTN